MPGIHHDASVVVICGGNGGEARMTLLLCMVKRPTRDEALTEDMVDSSEWLLLYEHSSHGEDARVLSLGFR